VILCVDVDYRVTEVVAACVAIHGWADASAAVEHVARFAEPPAAYEPGEFYKRELPYLTRAIAALATVPSVVVIDGYVWLGPDRAGLGAHLHAALGQVPVVGVAKHHFAGATTAREVLRGGSKQPLYVTAAGLSVDAAAAAIASMHGPHRLPTWIKRADQLARGR